MRDLAGFPLAVLVAALAALPLSAQETPLNPDEEVVITTASAEDLRLLLDAHAKALKAKDGARLAELLAEMSGHDNPEFKPLALAGLKYKASSADKKAAKALGAELGTTSKKDVEELTLAREAAVQAAAAHVLGNHPGDRSVLSALDKLLADKKVRKRKHEVTAAVILAFGRLKHDEIEEEVVKQLARPPTKEVARACVRYLGLVPARKYRSVRRLCDLLDPPEPGSVDDASNPPADFWQAAWEQWSWTRRDVTGALKQITGRVFRPAEGEHPSDSRKAIAYVDAHRAELGLE